MGGSGIVHLPASRGEVGEDSYKASVPTTKPRSGLRILKDVEGWMKLRRKLLLPILVVTLAFLFWGFNCIQVLAGPVTEGEVEVDPHALPRGQALFHGKGVCFACHGSEGDPSNVTNKDVARLNPRPTDIRTPTDKSVRQLYLVIKYGVPGTGMVALQETQDLRHEDVAHLISYMLSLQGKRLVVEDVVRQMFSPDTETDQAISAMCEADAIGDTDARDYCEDHYAKRYRDLIIGRPADIPVSRYTKIETSCKKSFAKDLDGLALCYRKEFSLTRQQAIENGKKGRLPKNSATP